jgi:hypothetical protein
MSDPIASPASFGNASGAVAVYGASGHTGGFVLRELARRGIPAVAVGRRAMPSNTGTPQRIAALDDPDALRRAFDGCSVVIHCAGPFLDTAAPVLEAALATGCHYIDVTAEQESARRTLHDYAHIARERGRLVIPAAGFYGGLADLLASALAGQAGHIDEVHVAVALDHWWPTAGTRQTGTRNTFPRMVIENGQLVAMPLPATGRDWDFGPPLGVQAMEQVPLSEAVTIHHHLPVRRLRSYLAASALHDLRDPNTAAPQAVDAQGRSAQRFSVQVELRDARGTRRATASGQDIYAVSAPLVAEAAARLLRGEGTTGCHTLGAAFDARDVLLALAPTPLRVILE